MIESDLRQALYDLGYLCGYFDHQQFDQSIRNRLTNLSAIVMRQPIEGSGEKTARPSIGPKLRPEDFPDVQARLARGDTKTAIAASYGIDRRGIDRFLTREAKRRHLAKDVREPAPEPELSPAALPDPDPILDSPPESLPDAPPDLEQPQPEPTPVANCRVEPSPLAASISHPGHQPKIPDADLPVIQDDLATNKSFTAIGARYGCTGQTVVNFLRKHGIDARRKKADPIGEVVSRKTAGTIEVPKGDGPASSVTGLPLTKFDRKSIKDQIRYGTGRRQIAENYGVTVEQLNRFLDGE
jgi:hypothetical protein